MIFNIRIFGGSVSGLSDVLCVIRATSLEDAHKTALQLNPHNFYVLEQVER
jgi:hypothetical protein